MFKFVIEKNRLKEIGELLRTQAGEKAYQAAAMAETDMKVEMGKQKRGRSYMRGKGKKTRRHVSSAPGEAPAIDYGHLINTIKTRRRKDSSDVSVSADYALPLEMGTARMAARPFFGPATKRAGEWYFLQLKMMKL